jgi:class 3 adenylate cyclase
VSFEDVIRRQLDLFESECADLIADCDAAERAYDAAGRDEAEERYSEYLDLVETGTERLAELRDNFASTMTEIAAEDYEQEFNAAVQRRLPRFALRSRISSPSSR